MAKILINPFTLWLKWLFSTLYLEFIYRGKKLSLGYMVRVSRVKFGQNNKLYKFVDVRNCAIGDFTYIAQRTIIKNAQIGKFCSIGPDSRIGLGIHPSRKYVSTHPIFYSTNKQAGISFVNSNNFDEFGDIEIGNDVCVGANVIIKDNVKIGDGAIIGAGAVVVGDIPPYAIAAGVPARVVDYRFNQDVITFLLKFKWWDKDMSWIEKHCHDFCDVTEFLNLNK